MGQGIQNQDNRRKFVTYSCSKKRLSAQYDYNLISEAAYELYFCYCYQLQAQRIPS